PLLLLIPSMKAYLEIPMDDLKPVTEAAGDKVGGLKKKLVGKENVGGLVCDKFLVESVDGKDKGRQALVWNAKELMDLPIKFMVKEKDGKMSGVQFSGVSMRKPPESLLVTPEGWTKHESMDLLFQQIMMKQVQSQLQNLTLPE
ncbi:hypothetical protein N9059_01900, partial [bacterium]|nr:hypothetical protein [bacterium]